MGTQNSFVSLVPGYGPSCCQGLVTHVAASSITVRVLEIFVPLNIILGCSTTCGCFLAHFVSSSVKLSVLAGLGEALCLFINEGAARS